MLVLANREGWIGSKFEVVFYVDMLSLRNTNLLMGSIVGIVSRSVAVGGQSNFCVGWTWRTSLDVSCGRMLVRPLLHRESRCP